MNNLTPLILTSIAGFSTMLGNLLLFINFRILFMCSSVIMSVLLSYIIFKISSSHKLVLYTLLIKSYPYFIYIKNNFCQTNKKDRFSSILEYSFS